MTKKHKKLLKRIIASVAVYVSAVIIDRLFEPQYFFRAALYLIPYLMIGYDVLFKACRNIIKGNMLDENFLMSVATVGAIVLAEFSEAVFVMLFYQIGELFQKIAVGKSRASISSLMDISPDQARVLRDGKEITVSPEEIGVGETVVVRAGEKIALDGVVIEGDSEVNTMALTGESEPRYICRGMKAISGCVNLSGVIKIKVQSAYSDSTVSRILELVENATAAKSRTDRFITRFARIYTPIVVIAAFLLFLIPSLITKDFSNWLGRALIFLVVSCPCALVISVPLSYFGGIGASSRKGILIKGAVYLEKLAEIKHAVFDKTGTLTEGKFTVTKAVSLNNCKDWINIALALERNSNHPISEAVCRYSAETLTNEIEYGISDFKEYAGMGICAEINAMTCGAGNYALMEYLGVEAEEVKENGSVVYVSVNGELSGYFVADDVIKSGAPVALSQLKKAGVQTLTLLSGDKQTVVERICRKLGIDRYYSSLMPQDKLRIMEEMMEKDKDGGFLYVGDGINDAPVIMRADVGIAMGALGSDAAIEAADVVIMDDDIGKIPRALEIAKKTRRIVRQNIVFALGVKVVVMILGAIGLANMWIAVFADVGVSVIAILNAMRTLKNNK